VTLAWLSPIHPRHRNYRGAALCFDIENEKLATKREDADWRCARNGTVQHEIFEGERAAAFAEDETMVIRVNCRADANSLEGTVRYGLVVSIGGCGRITPADLRRDCNSYSPGSRCWHSCNLTLSREDPRPPRAGCRQRDAEPVHARIRRAGFTRGCQLDIFDSELVRTSTSIRTSLLVKRQRFRRMVGITAL
jgi:hypothetical protein